MNMNMMDNNPIYMNMNNPIPMNMMNNPMNMNFNNPMDNFMNMNNPMNNNNMMNNPMDKMNLFMINTMNNHNMMNNPMNNMNLFMINTMNNLAKVYNSMKNSNNNVNKMEIVNKNMLKNDTNNSNNNNLNKKDIDYHIVDPENEDIIIRMTIVFITPAGFKVMLNTPRNKALWEILLEYVIKVGVGPNLLLNGLCFLFNGKKLTKADYIKIPDQIGIKDMANIIVIDPKFVLGAL